MSIDDRLKSLGITLPEMPGPKGNYVPAVHTGNLLYLSGKGPLDSTGKVGDDVSIETAYNDARSTGLLLLSVMQHELGTLDRVARIVKALGMVNATPLFEKHPQVINGFSDLMVEVFGARGHHARSAVGMGSLPNQITVEIEVIVEVAD